MTFGVPKVRIKYHFREILMINCPFTDDDLATLRTGCIKYFECGGECINGPISLLSGIAQSPMLLAYHFFGVAFYSIWVMFTHPQLVSSPSEKPVYATVTMDQYPYLMIKSARVARFVLFLNYRKLTCFTDVDSMRRLLPSFVVRTPMVVTRWLQREKKSSATDCTHFRCHGHRFCLGGTENGLLKMSLDEIDWIDGTLSEIRILYLRYYF